MKSKTVITMYSGTNSALTYLSSKLVKLLFPFPVISDL